MNLKKRVINSNYCTFLHGPPAHVGVCASETDTWVSAAAFDRWCSLWGRMLLLKGLKIEICIFYLYWRKIGAEVFNFSDHHNRLGKICIDLLTSVDYLGVLIVIKPGQHRLS